MTFAIIGDTDLFINQSKNDHSIMQISRNEAPV